MLIFVGASFLRKNKINNDMAYDSLSLLQICPSPISRFGLLFSKSPIVLHILWSSYSGHVSNALQKTKENIKQLLKLNTN